MTLIDPPAMHSLGANTYNARTDRRIVEALIGGRSREGVIGRDDFKVTPTGTPGMSVQVAAGLALIDGDSVARQGTYLAENDAALTVGPVTAPSSGLQRKDLVVLRDYDQSPDGGSAGSDLQAVEIVTGTPAASNPAVPALPGSAIPLAELSLTSSTTSLQASDIKDRRHRAPVAAVRPYVRVFPNGDGPTLPNAVATALAWPFGIASGDQDMYDSALPSRVTARTPGLYLVQANVSFASSATGRRGVAIRRNGTELGGESQNAYIPAIAGTIVVTVSGIVYLAEGSYVELVGYQDSGGSLVTWPYLNVVMIADGLT